MSDVWVTKTGERIPVSEMTDSHIQNAWTVFSKDLDESWAAENDIDQWGYFDALQAQAKRLGMLKREANRRGLKL